MIRELFVYGCENFVFLKFFRLDKSSSSTSCTVGLFTVAQRYHDNFLSTRDNFLSTHYTFMPVTSVFSFSIF